MQRDSRPYNKKVNGHRDRQTDTEAPVMSKAENRRGFYKPVRAPNCQQSARSWERPGAVSLVVSEGTNPVDALILNLQPAQVGGNEPVFLYRPVCDALLREP